MDLIATSIIVLLISAGGLYVASRESPPTKADIEHRQLLELSHKSIPEIQLAQEIRESLKTRAACYGMTENQLMTEALAAYEQLRRNV